MTTPPEVIARLAAADARVRELEEAVWVLGSFARHQAMQTKYLEMDPNSMSPEVAEMQMKSGLGLIRSMSEVNANPIARAAVAKKDVK